jgi:hypothetical protein
MSRHPPLGAGVVLCTNACQRYSMFYYPTLLPTSDDALIMLVGQGKPPPLTSNDTSGLGTGVMQD